MNKRLQDEYREFFYKGESTPFSLGTFAVVIFCLALLIIATFTKMDIAHLWPVIQDDSLTLGIKKYQLVPQIPVVLFTSAILGARFGSFVLVLYLLIGFFLWPVFGFGGGIEYVKSHFFGYILGFFWAMIFSSKILFHRYDIKNTLYAAVIGVLSIHISGILYSFVLSIFKFSTFALDPAIFMTQVEYDIVFSVLAILLAKPVKMIFWIAMKNEPKTVPQKKQEIKN